MKEGQSDESKEVKSEQQVWIFFVWPLVYPAELIRGVMLLIANG